MKRFRLADYVSISVYWFALSYLLMDLFNARQPGLGYAPFTRRPAWPTFRAH